jgi:cbb3-type cytochrome c oxidase subunit III
MKKALTMLFAAAGIAMLCLGLTAPSGQPILVCAASAGEAKNSFAGNAAAIKEGEKVFDEKCADCHGGDAMGGAGPDLTDDKWIYGGSDAEVFATVSGGRKGGMPSWKGQLKDEEIWKVIAYIRSLHK